MAENSGPGETKDPGVTKRAILLALFLIVLLAPAGFYLELVTKLAYNFNTMVPPITPLGLLFVVAALNSLRRKRKRPLTRRELLVVYILLTIGAPLVAHGTLLWFLSSSFGWQYYARTSPQWETAFFQFVPGWFYPPDWVAAEGFFQGRASVPWAQWWPPLAAWGSFFIALFTANLFALLLFRPQWITHERLSFPIAQVPLETVHDGPGGRGRLPVAKMFWAGFGIATFLNLQYQMPTIIPSLPSISLGEYMLIAWQKVGPLAGLGDIWMVLYPWCIALAYLIPKELSFSVWFFYLVRVALCVLAIAAGATPRKPEEWYGTVFPAPYFQGGGAVLAIGLLALWTGRRHLTRAVKSVFVRDFRADPQEPLAYRWVLLGLLLSCGYLVLFCTSAGCRSFVALALVGLTVSYHVVWARLRAENGMSFIGFPFTVDDMLTQPAGSASFLPAEIVTITATRWAYFPGWGESCEVITGASLDALKIADSARIRLRPLMLAMIGGFLFALVVGTYVVLTGTYHYGFYNLQPSGGWLAGMVRGGGTNIFDSLTNPSRLSLPAVVALASGMVVTLLLGQLRLRFWWWPLHPVGYLAANVWGSQWWYMPLFVGWLLKTLVVRYGGLRLYQKTVPIAIGIIVGDRVSEILWSLGLWLTRQYG